MKPRVYLTLLLLLIPFEASLFNPVSLAGLKPDLALAVIYVIGLVAGPGEAALAGLGIGLVQDIGSAGLLGLTAFTRGAIGLCVGILGRRVLDGTSASNGLFLVGFSVAEALLIAFFMQISYGAVPFFRLLVGRALPQALYTGLLGVLLLRGIGNTKVLNALTRRGLHKEQ